MVNLQSSDNKRAHDKNWITNGKRRSENEMADFIRMGGYGINQDTDSIFNHGLSRASVSIWVVSGPDQFIQVISLLNLTTSKKTKKTYTINSFTNKKKKKK